MGISDNNLRISFEYKYPDDAALVFTQTGDEYERYFDDPEWHLIHSEEV